MLFPTEGGGNVGPTIDFMGQKSLVCTTVPPSQQMPGTWIGYGTRSAVLNDQKVAFQLGSPATRMTAD